MAAARLTPNAVTAALAGDTNLKPVVQVVDLRSIAEVDQKVVVHVRSTGDAPILKQSKFKISGRDKFLKVIEFLRRQLHQDTLFVYINSAFSPNPDELVIDLYNNFGIDGKLVVNYALSAAWG